ncbi:hypothetical protein BDQ12DRAFT_675351 [Crucibulum laeve]|uniref:Peroxisome membrane anchor protein Pex14p N-terminal domain-containing protein n=1 Tax=Crucibulum laeve TaxID=68775 RepID=A0A5C3ME94_9AGAR|nr:hypothetical protein BDQ12DRAFT_675351 [Crucibulum laeve]
MPINKTASSPPANLPTTRASSSPNTDASSTTSSPASHPFPPIERPELLSRARSFLNSPQVQHQDTASKRRFLVEKGLDEVDIESLLREMPPQMPAIPPRTYPQLPPSNLPNLLLGLARLFSWLAGGSAALIFIYYRFLLPRITQTSLARNSLKSHHLSLLRRLTTSLASLKESQSESFSVLPHPEPYKEPSKYASCHSIADIFSTLHENEPDIEEVPPITLLRCGIIDFTKGKTGAEANPTTEDLFRYLEGKIPWLVSDDGLKFEQQLWETLSGCPLFIGTPPLPSPGTAIEPVQESVPPTTWAYATSAIQEPSPLAKSLDTLASSMPKHARTSPFQYTLQSLSDFTGYISTQVYVPYRPSLTGIGLPTSGGINPAEDEMKREIRALKGLVLNRRSFMPSIPKPSTFNHPQRSTP